MPLLKALSFAGKFPQLNYKVEELERLMDHPPLKQTDRPFEGQGHDIRFENRLPSVFSSITESYDFIKK